MRVIRFPRTDEATVGTVRYWRRCHLHNGFRVWHGGGIGTNEEKTPFWRDHICTKTFSESISSRSRSDGAGSAQRA
jgi:hypothetical protein